MATDSDSPDNKALSQSLPASPVIVGTTSQFGMDLRCLCVGIVVLVMTYHVTSSGYGRERWQGQTRPFGNFWADNRIGARWPLVNRRSGNTGNRSGTYPSEISPLLLDTLCSLCQRFPRRNYPLCVRRYCTF
ncbi:hypothetical protein KP79_PYT17113 [Mizuhopecten yessoensis]|uniref:Uncharacterized protein n=1 Tax=Mizuhopecten yessoensis TaxID=6573 RepID=A0A210PV45_MIZYE|nr:hypothetical protein KP79_PYT17113 [Mizuhopecten yessoensis]